MAALVCGVAIVGCTSADQPGVSAPPRDTLLADANLGGGSRAKAATACDRYASPRGRPGGVGSRDRPFHSVGRLVRSLRAGQVGCLTRGRFRHRGVVKMQRPRTTLRSLGGRRATIDGAIWVMPRATGARVAGLNLFSHDPVYRIPLKVQADDVTIARNDITAARSVSCVLIGSDRVASRTLIERNRIRHCGRSGKLDHLIYVSQSRNAVIRNNLLVDNPGGWAIHLFPDADRTLVEHNVIDSNRGGVIFAGDGFGDTSDGNLVRENVITNSNPRWNIEGSWSGGPLGQANSAERNCVSSMGPGAPSGIGPLQGFNVTNNRVASGRLYASRSNGDYRLNQRNPCLAVLGEVGGLDLRLDH